MRCIGCDGTGIHPELMPDVRSPCARCNGTGKTSDDDFEEKLRDATAKIGMVYFVRDDINQRIKIGTALNPLERLRALQTGSSVRLRLMAMCGGGRKTERQFHETWTARRLQGEWFDDRDREITRILLWTFRGDGIVWPER
ncbi:GIY-YIG nuclease family protein [Bradyrhizobium sp. DASA03005]|uniref:GIY-YIG nuclease family protein n=1 Tax=Bradyrhizobium sp. SPXBL-02 TaxID=3395912 RepID=UPI003F705DB1